MKQRQTPWLQQQLEAIWYQKKPGKWLLLPFTALFCLISFLKKKHNLSHQKAFPVPVIVIGNINIGGTGKTPLVIKLAQLLKAHDYQPCIITRGYKGCSKEWPVSVTHTTPVSVAGDEAKLMAIRTQVPVIAGGDRNADIEYALNHTSCNIILSDDGLQHYRMKRDLEIIVIDAKRRFGNGLCLPSGPLREMPKRLKHADFIITNGGPVLAPAHLMQVSGSHLINISTNEEKPVSAFSHVHVYTGIGNPQRFVDTLESLKLTISKQFFFVDHHHFSADDFSDRDPDSPIIMTEKDAVKCMHLGLINSWYLPVSAQLDKSFEDDFLRKLTQVSNQSK